MHSGARAVARRSLSPRCRYVLHESVQAQRVPHVAAPVADSAAIPTRPPPPAITLPRQAATNPLPAATTTVAAARAPARVAGANPRSYDGFHRTQRELQGFLPIRAGVQLHYP